MPVSKAQQKAVARYEAANYDKFLVRVDKGKKVGLQTHAGTRGESLNGFVNRAIDETVERDNGPSPIKSAQGVDIQLTDEEQAHIEKRRSALAQLSLPGTKATAPNEAVKQDKAVDGLTLHLGEDNAE